MPNNHGTSHAAEGASSFSKHGSMAEYSEVNETNSSKTATFASAHSDKLRTVVRILYASHGYEPAGSAARWSDGYYAVRWEQYGAIQGRRYPLTQTGWTEAEAHFHRLTGQHATR